MVTFEQYTSSLSTLEKLVNELLADTSVNVDFQSVTLNASGPEAVSVYDGSLNLGIGRGLLLTSGHIPGTANDVGWDGTDNSTVTGFNNGDADINAVVNTVFQTQSYDATSLQFSFTAADPNATSISFDIVFGSEEYPEWVDAFVDSAVVLVNGVNYALFNHDPAHPLSVISSNLAAGYFQDNADNHLAIQYDGVSNLLKIVAPINPGQTNTIKIAIADTGDHIYDSGIFIANLKAGTTPGSGVVATTSGTTGDDTITGTTKDELIDLKAGNDIAYAGAGDDIVVGGGGNDTLYGGTGNDVLEGDAGNNFLDGGDNNDTAVYAGKMADYTVTYNPLTGGTVTSKTTNETDTLANIENLKFSDGMLVYGTVGDDILKGGSGNDVIDGGLGTDAAVYTGAHTDYTVSYDAGTGAYTISGTHGEGSDTLVNMEAVQFSDGLYYLSQSDNHLSTQVSPPQNNQGSVAISGITMAGKTLTAVVTDPDGLPANAVTITYQWFSSTDNGVNWTPVGTSAKSYTIPAGVAGGTQYYVQATYTDLLGNSESPSSNSVTITQSNTFVVIPMTTDAYITAPLGASVKNPVTTLIQNAIDMGYTPGAATQAIIKGLGINTVNSGILAKVNPATYDAYAILTTPGIDTTTTPYKAALAYMEIEAEIAMAASFSDPTGMNLTQAVLNKAAAGTVFSFTSPPDLALAGLEDIPNGGPTYLTTVKDLSKNMINDPSTLAGIVTVWKDWASQGNDAIQTQFSGNTGNIESITAHINQAPTGTPTGTLPQAAYNAPVTIAEGDLLKGFTDPEGDPISVSGITTQNGDQLTNNNDGTWSFVTPAGFAGPLELQYTVSDNNAAFITATTLLVVQPPPPITLDAVSPISFTDTVDPLEMFDPTSGILTVSNQPAGTTLNFGITGGTDTGGLITKTGTYGTLTVDSATGDYTYAPDSAAINGLKEGATPTDTFTVTVSDGILGGNSSQSLTVNLTGANDQLITAPVSYDLADTAAYDHFAPLTGSIATASVDGGSTAVTFGIDTGSAIVQSYDGLYGSLSIDKGTGAYTYTPNDTAINALKAGDFPSDQFLVAVTDSLGVTSTGSFTVNLTGAYDPATLGIQQDTLSYNDTAVDDNLNTVSGTLAFSNADGSSLSFTIDGETANDGSISTRTGAYGTLAVNVATGAYTFAPDNAAIQGLKSGVTTEDFAITLFDGTTSSSAVLTIDLAGANDPTVFSGDTGGAVTENTLLTGGGTLTVSDRDTGDASVTPQTSSAGIFGTFSIGSNGVWSYTLNNSSAAVKTLNDGDSRTDTFTVTAASGVTQNITIAVNGTTEIKNGTGGADILNGTLYGDRISGLVGNDNLYGYGGNDILDGGAGIDTMVGGDGDDTYLVDNSLDAITETPTGGTELVKSSATYVLPVNVENLALTGAGAINGTGNILANIITGNGGANVIDGKGGSDSLDGGAGGDTYLFYQGSDHPAAEIHDTGLTGIDEVRFASSTPDTLTLYAGDSGIERVVLGTLTTMNVALNADAHLVTNALTLAGNTAANTLVGTGYNDILTGGKGADVLSGGSGSDTFVFSPGDSGQSTNFDTITDFAKGAFGTGDIIDYATALTIGGSAAAATVDQAAINAVTGVASFAAGSGANLADALGAIAKRFTAATDTSGEFAFFNVNGGGDNFLFISDGVAGVTANDVVVRLSGVTSVGQIDRTGGNLGITG